ncbi:MAG: alcohol dehydrogenase catalytic domain-containing protein [Armatimonadetes bacterium]|nr:alcohol dehydrogenase catalytic domain-containing protein [Armatimonadota bacterium]MBS1726249.1 alcohol dehydrogenase catalytic domain-containing protein [Armatimonadota bacterium]
MKIARYVGDGEVKIVEESEPTCPEGGLLVQTEACGLCSGELMSWYMDRKVPHVIGHEVTGVVVESKDSRFPVGSRIFPHHHAPCGKCEYCTTGRSVHCKQWKETKLLPGGMAERFAVPLGNLTDTILVNPLRAIDAALIEPMACVMKSLRTAGHAEKPAVIGLGVMGLMHMIALGEKAVGYDINPLRVAWAKRTGLDARANDESEECSHDVVFVCPGTQEAFDAAVKMVQPGGRICMFAPLAPDKPLAMPQELYFRDIAVLNSYSCGPEDTKAAWELIGKGILKAEQVVSHFIKLDELPAMYRLMKSGEILKPMVVF